MTTVVLTDLGTQGIHLDIPSHLLPPEVWSNGQNVRFIDGYAERALGHAQVYVPGLSGLGFIFNVPGPTDSFWLSASLTTVMGYSGGTVTTLKSIANAANFRDWNGCLFGGIPILNNFADIPVYWPNLALATPLANMTGWPATLRARVIRNFGPYLIAISLNDNGNLLPHAIRWSHKADPGTLPSSWDVTDPAVDAGQTHLTDVEGGELQNGLLLGNLLVLYKKRSTHLMRFIGGTDIMGFDFLFNQGVYSPRSVCIIDSGRRHFVVGEDDVYVHSATKDVQYPLDARSRRALYAEIDQDNKLNSFCYENPYYEEACFCYPTIGNTYPNKAMVWNYRKNTIGYKQMEGLSVDIGDFSVAGPTWDAVTSTWDAYVGPWNLEGARKILAADPLAGNKIWGLDAGFTFGTAVNTPWSLQRTGLAVIGKDRQGKPVADYTSQKLFRRVWSKYTGSGQLEVRLGAQDEINGPIFWDSFQVFDPTVRYNDFEIHGRLGAIEYRGLTDADGKLEGYDLEFDILGAL